MFNFLVHFQAGLIGLVAYHLGLLFSQYYKEVTLTDYFPMTLLFASSGLYYVIRSLISKDSFLKISLSILGLVSIIYALMIDETSFNNGKDIKLLVGVWIGITLFNLYKYLTTRSLGKLKQKGINE